MGLGNTVGIFEINETGRKEGWTRNKRKKQKKEMKETKETNGRKETTVTKETNERKPGCPRRPRRRMQSLGRSPLMPPLPLQSSLSRHPASWVARLCPPWHEKKAKANGVGYQKKRANTTVHYTTQEVQHSTLHYTGGSTACYTIQYTTLYRRYSTLHYTGGSTACYAMQVEGRKALQFLECKIPERREYKAKRRETGGETWKEIGTRKGG
jgi:hypothetical protein